MNELETIQTEKSLEGMKRADAPAIWEDFAEQARKLMATADTLKVTSVTQVAEMKLARSTRLALRTVRIAVENKRKELGEFHLRQTQIINTAAKFLKDQIEPLEERLLLQEEFIERETERIEADNRAKRIAELTPHMNGIPIAADLGKITDEAYTAMLQGAKDSNAARIERERKEKEEAEAKAKAEAEAREKMRLENERLKQEAKEREEAARKEREAAEIERQKSKAEADKALREAAEAARKEREAIETKAKAERDAAEKKARAEREALEAKAKKEREEAAALAKQEREARESLEAKIKADKEFVAKLEAERIAKERAAQAAPDKAKLLAYAEAISRINVPEMATDNGKAAKTSITAQVGKLLALIETKANTLASGELL